MAMIKRHDRERIWNEKAKSKPKTKPKPKPEEVGIGRIS